MQGFWKETEGRERGEIKDMNYHLHWQTKAKWLLVLVRDITTISEGFIDTSRTDAKLGQIWKAKKGERVNVKTASRRTFFLADHTWQEEGFENENYVYDFQNNCMVHI